MNTRVPARSSIAHHTTDEKIILSEIRMSRLHHPRGTLYAMILLAVVFGLFGVFAAAFEPSYSPPPSSFEGTAVIFKDWLFSGGWH